MISFFKKNIVREAFWYTSANAVVQICSLIGVLLVSRYLGPTNIGVYSFVQNFIAFFVTVLTSMDIYANWHIVQSSNSKYELIKYTYQKAIVTIPVVTVLLLTSLILLPSTVFYLTAILCLPFVTNIFSAFVFVAQEQRKVRLVSSAMIVGALLLLALKVFAVHIGARLSTFVFINSIDGFIITALCTFYFVKNYKKEDYFYTPRASDFKTLARYSVVPLAYLLFWFTIVRADQFIIPIYYNAYSLGIYSSAVKVIEMTNVIIVILQALVIPRIMHISDPSNGKRNMNITVALYTLAGLVTACTIYVLSKQIVTILFGVTFYQTAEILRIYVWSIPGLFVSYLLALVFMSQKKYKLLAAHALFFAICNVALLYILTPIFGINGVASVSVIIYTLSAVGYYGMWRKSI